MFKLLYEGVRQTLSIFLAADPSARDRKVMGRVEDRLDYL